MVTVRCINHTDDPHTCKVIMDEPAAQTYDKHNCFVWNRQHYHMTPLYTSSECGTCGKITGFMWRSKWYRLRSLFTSNPIKSIT